MAHILLVEDSKTQAFAVSRMLERRGYQVTVAKNGREGIQFAFQLQPDIILMDIVLPDANGFQATRAIANNSRTAHIPVVMLSAKDQQSDKLWALRQGAMSYLTKPVKEPLLISTINSVLGGPAKASA